MSRLSQHPFPVSARFEKSLVLTYAIDLESLTLEIPPCLEWDLHEKRRAFVAVALVRTKELRPTGFPRFLGKDFTLIGYRVFVRYRAADGRRLRGLHILGSETDRPFMRLLGGLFTTYRYETVAIDWESTPETESIRSSAGLRIEVSRVDEDSPTPEGSPFADWHQARLFSGPLPFTFSWNADRGEVVIVEGTRSDWKPRPMRVLAEDVPFFSRLAPGPMRLANAFLVEDVAYAWKRGRVETWKG